MFILQIINTLYCIYNVFIRPFLCVIPLHNNDKYFDLIKKIN
jgi:hypothetical protein